MKTFAIILSAGNSTRFGGTTKKQFYLLKGKPVLYYSLKSFNEAKAIDEIVLVTLKKDIEKVKQFVLENNFNRVKLVVSGGDTRQQSVKNGLDAINESNGIVLIHDAARPLVDEGIINNLIKALDNADGATPALKVFDTIVKANNNELVSYENRDELYRIQTPQAFKLDVIKLAHETFLGENATDDSHLVKQLHKKVVIINGKEKLRKITKLEDTDALEAYIEKNEQLQN